MILSYIYIFNGECAEALKYYAEAFDGAVVSARRYAEMPLAGSYNMSETGLAMVWNSELTIPFGVNAINFNMSDSLLVAISSAVSVSSQTHFPVICIEHDDEQYVRGLFAKLYGDGYNFDDVQKGCTGDKYGIRWIYKKSDTRSIYLVFEFCGYCKDVVDYISDACGVSAGETVTYADAWERGCMEEADIAGMQKIYGAKVNLQSDHYTYTMEFKDTYDSAKYNKDTDDPAAHKFYQIVLKLEDADEERLKATFRKLSVGATTNREISRNESGVLYGSLIDRYGIVWEVSSITV